METAKKTPEIVHESEAQRQHIRLAFPAYAEIGGARHSVKDISSGGMAITGVEGNYASGQTLAIRLILPFVDFSLEISVDIQIQHFDKENKSIGCRFINLSANQVSILTHVIKAFIAGDIITAGDLLGVTSRDNFVKVRKAKAGAQSAGISIARQLPGILLISVIGLAAAALIFSNIYDRIFVLKSSQGAVVGPAIEIKAEAEGTLKFLVSPDTVTVKPGQPLAAIVGAADAAVGQQAPGYVIKSPCECFLSRNKAQNGEFLAVGAPVLTLVPVTAEPIVTVALEPRNGSRVPLNGAVTVSIPGIDGEITGRVLSVESNLPAILSGASSISGTEGTPTAGPAVIVKIRPDQKLPADLIGRPAVAEFRTY